MGVLWKHFKICPISFLDILAMVHITKNSSKQASSNVSKGHSRGSLTEKPSDVGDDSEGG